MIGDRKLTPKEVLEDKKRRLEALSEPLDFDKIRKQQKQQPLNTKIVQANRILRLQSIKVLHKERLDIMKQTDRPIIFAPTHNGKFDIQILWEVLKNFHWYLMSGDNADLPATMEGKFLDKQGVISFDRDDPNDRKVAFDTALRLLFNKINIMLYSEGTWNISDELLVLELFIGIVRLARATNAIILPIGLETINSCKYVVNFGEAFDVNAIEDDIRAINILRDELASLKFEIMMNRQNKSLMGIGNTDELENVKLVSRQKLSIKSYERYIRARLKECPYMNKELVLKFRRTDPKKINIEQAFDNSLGCNSDKTYTFMEPKDCPPIDIKLAQLQDVTERIKNREMQAILYEQDINNLTEARKAFALRYGQRN